MQSIGKERKAMEIIHETLEIIKDLVEILVLALTADKLIKKEESKKP
jgi:hypothetical protein